MHSHLDIFFIECFSRVLDGIFDIFEKGDRDFLSRSLYAHEVEQSVERSTHGEDMSDTFVQECGVWIFGISQDLEIS